VANAAQNACRPASRLAAIGSRLSAIGVAGVDICDEVRSNPFLKAAHIYDGRALPFEGPCFDACVSDYVLEHIEDPRQHFCEVARILKPRGTDCFRTPNSWHYVWVAARLLPHKIHLLLANRLRSLPPGAHDPYPTFYRANTFQAVRKLSTAAGLTPVEISLIEKEPSYGANSAALFFTMMAYERLVNRWELLKVMRVNILAAAQKPGH